MTAATWLLFACSTAGVVLNIRRSRWSYGLWVFTGLAWFVVAVHSELWGWAARELLFAALAVYGFVRWGKVR